MTLCSVLLSITTASEGAGILWDGPVNSLRPYRGQIVQVSMKAFSKQLRRACRDAFNHNREIIVQAIIIYSKLPIPETSERLSTSVQQFDFWDLLGN